jgi:homoserine dehydrogenase
VGAPFSIPVAELEAMRPAESGHRMGKAYMRFIVADRPGVLAEIAAAMRDAGVSIESLIQQGGRSHLGGAHLGGADQGEPVLIAVVTHEGPERCIAEALRLLEGSPSLVEPPLVMHILGGD